MLKKLYKYTKIFSMPKIKTKSGTKKRFRVTATGKVVMFPSCKRHNLSKRSKKMKRYAKGPTIMSKQDTRIVKKYMNVKI
jgi:large subunit ribosomal protein L35|tara:strand:+ start:303 stop:542 length:240 start_codon:yes stop_codon:yes gene_type:complete